MRDIERRLGVLEDIQEIKRLKASYCAFCDNSYDADGLSSLFAENGVMDDGWRGGAEGREEIRKFFIKAGPRVPFARHMVMNPIIEVAGDEAKGTWYLFEACTYLEGNRAVWGSARYDEELRKGRLGVEVQERQAQRLLLGTLRPGLGKERVGLSREAIDSTHTLA